MQRSHTDKYHPSANNNMEEVTETSSICSQSRFIYFPPVVHWVEAYREKWKMYSHNLLNENSNTTLQKNVITSKSPAFSL